MTAFKHLPIRFDPIDLERICGEHLTGYLRFDEYAIKDRPYLYSLVEGKIKFGVRPTRANITCIQAPGAVTHTDLWPSALNVYITAGEDLTYFWPPQEPARRDEFGPAYYAQAQAPIASFQASAGDVYLLNTHIPHSVEMKWTSKPRYMLRFIWETLTFEQALATIEIL